MERSSTVEISLLQAQLYVLIGTLHDGGKKTVSTM